MARPRGGEWLREEVASWSTSTVAVVVSLLELHEIRDLELREEAALCADHRIEFRHFPIPDRGMPSSDKAVSALVAELHPVLTQGRAVAIHCRAGIGRTGLVAGCLLHSLRVPYNEIFHVLGRSRGVAMPDTSSQVEWVEKYTRAYPNAL
jgi:protein-tyrosine phosphatase